MFNSVNQVLSLVSHIHSQSQDFLQKKLKDLGLKKMATSHANILFCLSENEELSLGELTEKINRDKSTTTALIRKLEKEGFVSVKKDNYDSRKKLISLTQEGKKYKEATAGLSRQLLETSYNNFSEEEKQLLLKLLSKLSLNLK